MTAPTVLLFDIDGTLISCGGAGRVAMSAAFFEVTGRSDVCDFPFGGSTDRAISRQGLTNAGASVGDAAIDAFLEVYLAKLPAAITASEGYRVHPAVEPILDRSAARPNTAIGLGTGNVERGARAKLAPAGLGARFAFGGFGCDHEERPRLIEAGARRGAAALGLPLERCRVVVIGDTTRDVTAAHAIGAECLGVCTGSGTEEELRGVGAEYVVQDLTDPEAARFLSV